ncbi:MAG: hypothetical protein H7831_11555 [Magnetococcus sp. WYHC-3]
MTEQEYQQISNLSLKETTQKERSEAFFQALFLYLLRRQNEHTYSPYFPVATILVDAYTKDRLLINRALEKTGSIVQLMINYADWKIFCFVDAKYLEPPNEISDAAKWLLDTLFAKPE